MSMSVGMENVQGGFGETANKVIDSLKGAAVWTGRHISKGFHKFVELMKSAWNTMFPIIKDFAIRTADFLRTAPGIGLVLGLSSISFAYASRENHDNKWVSLSLQAASVITAIGAGAILGYGYATGMKLPLI